MILPFGVVQEETGIVVLVMLIFWLLEVTVKLPVAVPQPPASVTVTV